MSKRFLDDASVVSESRNFIYRKHVIPLWVLLLIFSFCISTVLSLYTIFPEQQYIALMGAIFLFTVLFMASFVLDFRYKNLINAVEFQNALFSGAARIATEFCLIVRNDGKIVYVDPEYNRKVFRVTNTKMRNLKILLDAGSVSEIEREKLFAALSVGKSERIPFKLPRADSSLKPRNLTLDPIRVPSEAESIGTLTLSVSPLDRPSGYSLLRVRQEEYKKEYEEYLENFQIGFYSTTNSGEFSYISDSFEQTLGYAPGKIVADKINISDLIFDHEIARDFRLTRKEKQEVTVLRSRSNMPVYAFINQTLIRSSNGRVVGRQGIVTPLLRAAVIDKDYVVNKLSKSPDLIKYSPIATALLDNKGLITDLNRSFRDLANIVSPNKMNIFNLVNPDNQENVKYFFHEVLSGKNDGLKPIDILLMVPNQENKAASLYLNRVTDAYGQLQGIIAHMIDTTELKNLEMRFVHSQKMQAVGQLAGGIAHDFNNLLTAMMGFCDLLLMRHPAGDASFSDIMQVKQNANRAANLVKQLLAFSRKQTLQPEIINITDSLADLSNLIGRLIGENIELKMIHGRDLKYIKVDQVQLEQVIINLAVNARDAMPDGGVLTITTNNIVIDEDHPINKNLIPPASDEAIEKGEYVLIEVSDTGHGMSREIISKIFEPFFTTKALGSGTGLGLSTVYGIVKQTGGYIYIASKLGKGTKFSIFLKAYNRTEEKNKNTARLKDDVEKQDIADLSGTGNILLVEDETAVRIFSHNALTNKGFTVLDADCAERALEIVKENGKEIDVIITDVVMPGMSGPDMIRQISSEYPGIKVIFISGYGEDAFIETYGNDRTFNFLSKPYSLKQLITKVKEVLGEGVKR